MTTTTVRHALSLPAGQSRAGTQIRVELCTPSFDSASVTLSGVAHVNVARNGACDLKLTPNSELNPAGTWYRITDPDGTQWAAVVPAGGPVTLEACLVDDPATPGLVVAGVQTVTGAGVDNTDPRNPVVDGGGGGAVDSVNGQVGVVVLSAADVGADTAAARDTAIGLEATARANADTTLANLITTEATTRGNADTANATAIANEVTRATGVEAVKADLVAGKVPTSQLPALSINEVFPVASQAAMLALTAQRGDIARRTDFTPNHLYLLTTDSPATLGDWLLIVSDPGAGVDTVNGQSGIVVLGAADVGADTAAARDTAIANQHTTDVTLFQPADPDLTAIAGLDAATAGALVTDGAGWFRKTYAQLKTALGLVKGDVGLGNVDNTSDANKPVSTAQAAADALAAPKTTATIDLIDRFDNTTETVPAGTTTNCSTAGVTKTAPALAGSVGTPPLRWAVKNLAAGSITVSYPDQAGAAQSLTILSGETRTFRQKSTLGWGVESGAIALSTLDARYILDTIGTTKGDQIGFTGSGAPVRHAIGADGTVQTADSTQADGWKWAAPSSGVSGRWGDGSDGTVTISVNTSLARDMYYDNLTINAGVTLTTNGWRVFVRNTLTINSTGVLGNPGLVGTGGTNNFGGGAAGTSQVLAGGKGGANGGTAAGSAGTNAASCLVASPGGAGGAGGTGAAGAGGTATLASTVYTLMPKSPPSAFDFTFIANGSIVGPGGGGGGGGGGGDGTNAGGGGGSAGGVCVVNARVIVNNGTITAAGGNGRTPTTGNAGGGGGGAGGIVFVNTTSLTGTGTVTAAGGTHGNGVGTGANGVDGTAGLAQTITWSF